VEQATQLFAFISAVFGAGTAVIAFFKAMLDLRQRLQRPGTAPTASSAAAVPQAQASRAASTPQGYPSAATAAYPPYHSPRARAGSPPFWRRSLPYPRLASAAITTLLASVALSAANGSLFKTSATRTNVLTGALTLAVFVAFCCATYFAVRAGRKAVRLRRWGWLLTLFFPIYGWIIFGLFAPTAAQSVTAKERVPVA
jgi:hypothetical protein